MTPAARLQAILDLISEIDTVPRPADAIVSAWFRARRQIGDADRGEIIAQLQELLRHQARLGWWLDRHGRKDTHRNRLLAFLALVERRKPDQLKRLFSGAKYAPAILTEAEATLVVKLQGSPADHPAMPDDVRLECPDWAAAALRRRFGADFETEMAAMLTPPPLDLRVNTLKTTRAHSLRALRDIGLPAEVSAVAPFGIRVGARLSLAHLPGLKTA